jgi:hypothetical protein
MRTFAEYFDYLKMVAGLYLPTLSFVLTGAYIWFYVTNTYVIGVYVFIYLFSVVYVYCIEQFPRWYCRLRWGMDKYPYFHKPIFSPTLWLVLSIIWPIWGTLITVIFLPRDIIYGLNIIIRYLFKTSKE